MRPGWDSRNFATDILNSFSYGWHFSVISISPKIVSGIKKIDIGSGLWRAT